MPDDLEISSDLVGSVSIDLRGPSGEIEKLSNRGENRLWCWDFSDIHKPGERTFQIDERNIQPCRRGMRAGAGDTGADPAAIRAAHAT